MKKDMRKRFARDTIVTGFALFAMLFGAGNLIFPPYLGWGSASNWLVGFLCFLLADAGLSMLALYNAAKLGSGPRVTARLGRGVSLLLMTMTVICIGPLLAVPRTAATTYEFGVVPLFPQVSSWLFSLLFFAVVSE